MNYQLKWELNILVVWSSFIICHFEALGITDWSFWWLNEVLRVHRSPCWHLKIYCDDPMSTLPIGSMYAIYGNMDPINIHIYHQYTPNVSIYTIHGSYGLCRPCFERTQSTPWFSLRPESSLSFRQENQLSSGIPFAGRCSLAQGWRSTINHHKSNGWPSKKPVYLS